MGKQTLKELDEYIEFMEEVHRRLIDEYEKFSFVCLAAKNVLQCDEDYLDMKFPLFYKWVFKVGKRLALRLPDCVLGRQERVKVWQEKDIANTWSAWDVDTRGERVEIVKQYVKHLKQRRSRENRRKSRRR